MGGMVVTGSLWGAQVAAWGIIAVGAAWIAGRNIMTWRTNPASGRMLAIVMGLLCMAAILRVGTGLDWWRVPIPGYGLGRGLGVPTASFDRRGS